MIETPAMDDALDSALVATTRGDFSGALRLVLDYWRRARSPHAAAMVDILAARVPDALSHKLAEVVTPRVSSTAQKLEELRDVDDPRLARFALDALADPPFAASTAQDFYLTLADVLERLRDARLHDELPTIAKVLRARLARKPMYEAIVERLEDVAAKLPPPEPPSPVETKLLELLKPARTGEELLAAIYEAPDDDTARHVYADYLLERGDPRGELIALQLHRPRGAAPSPRETELLKRHGKQWLGPLASVLRWGKSYSDTRFERGFVSNADFIDNASKKLALIVTDPAWATVEKLENYVVSRALLAKAPLRALKHLRFPLDGEAGAAILSRTDTLPIESAHVGTADIDLDAFRRVLPRLDTLISSMQTITAAAVAPFLALPVKTMIVESWYRPPDEVTSALAEFEAATRQLEGAPARVEELVLHGPFGPRLQEHAPKVTLRRDASGELRRDGDR